jgi:hypothetical protein
METATQLGPLQGANLSHRIEICVVFWGHSPKRQ